MSCLLFGYNISNHIRFIADKFYREVNHYSSFKYKQKYDKNIFINKGILPGLQSSDNISYKVFECHDYDDGNGVY